MFQIYYTKGFEKDAKKILTPKEFEEMETYFEMNIKLNGDKIGKPLTYNYFREIKIGGKRIYYLLYKNIALILVVGVSRNKKDQQRVIDKIKLDLSYYRELAYELYKKLK